MEKTRADCEAVGRAAVWPGFKEKDKRDDALIRANERLKMLEEVEKYIKLVPSLQSRVETLKEELNIQP